MKRHLLAIFLLPTLACGGCLFKDNSTQKPDLSVDMTVREVSLSNMDEIEMLDKARSAVVGISMDVTGGYVIGSGVAMAEGGYILTNNHVIEEGGNITLYYADKTTGSGKVLWKDAGLDLAILKSSRNIPYLRAGNSQELKVGQTVFAMGTPLTLQFKHTVTKGIVSALGRTLEVDGNNGSNFLQSLVQHDASINPGNSGGPLINTDGEVVGINTLKASEGEGLGFASPIEVGKAAIERISENENYKTAYLGLFGFDSEIAKVYGESLNEDGVYVISTTGPAEEAGLKKGDLVTKFGEKEIRSMLDLKLALFDYNNGDSVEIEYLRNGKIMLGQVTLSQK